MMNIGVIGCGYWGPNLIRNFQSLDICRVAKLCDVNSSRLAYLQKMYPATEVSENADALITDPAIDAIAIATPVFTHYELAKKALLAGKHAFIEKPMASSAAQCRELNELAARNKLTLMVGHTFLYSAPVRRIKEIINSGEIGDILFISARRLNLGLFQKDINVTWDLAPHDISIILYIAPYAPVAINCQGKAHINAGIEDVSNMSIDFHNGVFATVQSSWLDPNKVRQITIVGSRKMIVYDDNEPLEKVKIYDKRVETPPHYDTFAEFQYSYHYGDVNTPYIRQIEPLKTECEHFLNCINTGEKPLTSGIEGLQVVQILEAASKSLNQNGCRIAL
jgi:predicted dehydrogenase